MADKNDILDKFYSGEEPSAEELDAWYASFGDGRDVRRRRLLQDKYDFLKATSLKEGLMAFGFDHGDGWLPILEKLFEDIAIVVKRDALTDFKIGQVKEKFGILIVHFDNGNEDIDALVANARELSKGICEECGSSGSRRDLGGWYATLCDKCCRLRKTIQGFGGLI